MSKASPHYMPVPGEDDASKQDILESNDHAPGTAPSWALSALVLILFSTLSFAGGYFLGREHTEHSDYEGRKTPQVESLETTWETFYWNTPYTTSDNRTHTDELWERILPSHGIVAIDRTWAKEHNWPASMYLPSDHTKGVYLLESYHYLHCLRILRKTFWEAVEGRPYTHHPSAHTDHCFGALLQYVICNADSTPLYTWGDFTAGDGQMHQCRSWSRLRDYATKNTACFRDSVKAIPLGEHFGYCDNGDDGVIELSG